MWFLVFLLLCFSDLKARYVVMIFACACMVEGYNIYTRHQEQQTRLELLQQSAKFYNDTFNLINSIKEEELNYE